VHAHFAYMYVVRTHRLRAWHGARELRPRAPYAGVTHQNKPSLFPSTPHVVIRVYRSDEFRVFERLLITNTEGNVLMIKYICYDNFKKFLQTKTEEKKEIRKER